MAFLGCVAQSAARQAGVALYGLRAEVAVIALATLGTTAAVRPSGVIMPAVAGLALAAVSAVTDLQTGYVFDRVLIASALPILILGFLARDVSSLAGGALIGGGVPALLYTVTFGRGIGLGDVKLGAVLGAAAGANEALPLIVIAFIAGGAVATILLLARRCSAGQPLPLAPFLAIGTDVCFLSGGLR